MRVRLTPQKGFYNHRQVEIHLNPQIALFSTLQVVWLDLCLRKHIPSTALKLVSVQPGAITHAAKHSSSCTRPPAVSCRPLGPVCVGSL